MKKLFLLLVAVLSIGLCASAQTRTVKGVVLDAANEEPVIGASIVAVGQTTGVVTDVNGEFAAVVPAAAKAIKVSCVGYKTQTVNITGANLTIHLQSDATALGDVMVVAYGTAKKSEYTGSASVVKADQIENTMVTNVANALKGKTAGVQLNSSNGQPGTAPSVYIRGVGSINASTQPLYVVDGIPVDAGDIPQLNSMDVESMTVLKDAAAAALYGARGANGVILITTKRGKEGEAKVTFDARWGANSRQVKNYDVIKSPAQYYELEYQALYNGYAPTYGAATAHSMANAELGSVFGEGYNIWTLAPGQSLVGTNGKLNPNATLGFSDGYNYYTPDNWADNSFRNGLRQEYSLSVSGATNRFNYYISAAYLGDEGVIIGSDYDRLATRANISYEAKKWLTVNSNMSYVHVTSGWPDDQTTTNSGSNVFLMANTIAPIYPMFIREANGDILYDKSTGRPVYDYGDGLYSGGIRNFYYRSNGVSELIYNKTEYLMDIFSGKWGLDIHPIKGLNINGNLGYYLDNTRSHLLYNNLYGQMAEYGGEAEQGFSRARSLNLQLLATYKHTIADVHNLSYLLGYESYDYNSENLWGWGRGLYQPGVWVVNNTLNNDERKSSGSAGSYATRGFLGQINYNYDSKYFFMFNFRRDASSRFAPKHRWGNFFSVSAGWDIAKEAFMTDFTNVDLLKFKASFGQQGNDGIGNNYAYLDQYGLTGVDQWSDGTLVYKGNPELTWETSNALNVGFDFSFFKGRIDGSLEYFQRQTSDMLYNKPVAPSNGYSSIPMNVGSMKNYGIELELNGGIIRTKDITWDAYVNATWIRNKILKLSPDLNGELKSGMTIFQEGKSRYQYYLVEYAGVNAENGNPMYMALDEEGVEYKTENYDTAYATNRKATGNNLPWLYGGFGTSFQAYGFDVAVGFTYQLGGRVYDSGYANLMHCGGTGDAGTNWHTDILNAWTPENTNTDIPSLNALRSYTMSSTWTDQALTSSNFLSLNNITVGYTLPSKLTRQIGIESVRVYCAGDNIALWSKRKGLDPRNGYGILDSNMYYSAVRNISGGLRVVF